MNLLELKEVVSNAPHHVDKPSLYLYRVRHLSRTMQRLGHSSSSYHEWDQFGPNNGYDRH